MVMHPVVRSILLLVWSCCILGPPEVSAQMFVCRDRSGAMQYTNVPNGSDCKPLEEKRRSIRRSWGPLSPSGVSTYDQHIWAAGNRYNVDPYLIKAVIKAESSFNSRAVSRKGAQGLMQLMPGTAQELRVRDPFNPKDNIHGGTRYLRQMLDTFNGNLILSIAAYNAGPNAVIRAKGVPRIPETMQYVVKVLTLYKGYRNSAGG